MLTKKKYIFQQKLVIYYDLLFLKNNKLLKAMLDKKQRNAKTEYNWYKDTTMIFLLLPFILKKNKKNHLFLTKEEIDAESEFETLLYTSKSMLYKYILRKNTFFFYDKLPIAAMNSVHTIKNIQQKQNLPLNRKRTNLQFALDLLNSLKKRGQMQDKVPQQSNKVVSQSGSVDQKVNEVITKLTKLLSRHTLLSIRNKKAVSSININFKKSKYNYNNKSKSDRNNASIIQNQKNQLNRTTNTLPQNGVNVPDTKSKEPLPRYTSLYKKKKSCKNEVQLHLNMYMYYIFNNPIIRYLINFFTKKGLKEKAELFFFSMILNIKKEYNIQFLNYLLSTIHKYRPLVGLTEQRMGRKLISKPVILKIRDQFVLPLKWLLFTVVKTRQKQIASSLLEILNATNNNTGIIVSKVMELHEKAFKNRNYIYFKKKKKKHFI